MWEGRRYEGRWLDRGLLVFCLRVIVSLVKIYLFKMGLRSVYVGVSF